MLFGFRRKLVYYRPSEPHISFKLVADHHIRALAAHGWQVTEA